MEMGDIHISQLMSWKHSHDKLFNWVGQWDLSKIIQNKVAVGSAGKVKSHFLID